MLEPPRLGNPGGGRENPIYPWRLQSCTWRLQRFVENFSEKSGLSMLSDSIKPPCLSSQEERITLTPDVHHADKIRCFVNTACWWNRQWVKDVTSEIKTTHRKQKNVARKWNPTKFMKKSCVLYLFAGILYILFTESVNQINLKLWSWDTEVVQLFLWPEQCSEWLNDIPWLRRLTTTPLRAWHAIMNYTEKLNRSILF